MLKLGAVITLVVVRVPAILMTAYCAEVDVMFVAASSPAVLASVMAPSPVKVSVPAIAISK